MGTILRDYFSLNRATMVRVFCFAYPFFLLGQTAVIVQKWHGDKPLMLLFLGLFSVFGLALFIASFVLLIGVLDACVRGRRLAREARMSLKSYVTSDEYRVTGRQQLIRPAVKLGCF
jgi:hypothetical protein